MFQPERRVVGGGLSTPALLLIGGVVAYVVALTLRTLINNLVRSPLRHVPGPWPAKLSKAWLLAIELRGRRFLYIHALHERYGPVVRVGPNELSFATAAAARDIYVGVDVPVAAASTPSDSGTGDEKKAQQHQRSPATTAMTTKTFPKAPIYEISRKTLAWMTDEAEYREHVRRVGHVFSPALMPALEPVIRSELAPLLRALDERRGGPVDMLHWFRMFALDVAGQLFLGRSFDGLTNPTPPKFAHYMDTAIHSWFFKGFLPRTYALLRRLPYKPQRLHEFLESGDGVYEYSEKALDEFIARHGRKSTSRLPLARLLAGNEARGLPPLPDKQIANEVMVMLFAGTDTTATTLAYLFFELARHPAWYARLRAEVCRAVAAAAAAAAPASAAASPDEGGAVALGEQQLSYATAKSLPVLNAVVWETLRTYPAIPSSLARRVPRGGAPVTGMPRGAWLPPDTVVSASTITLQRNADVFPDPYAWRPERWLARAAAPSVPLFPSASTPSHATTMQDAGSGAEMGFSVEDGGRAGGDDEALAVYEVDAEMNAHMQVFSRGGRACLGKTMAHMEMKLAVAALVQRYTGVRLADARATAEDMHMTDAFVLVPRGRRCMLVFE